MASSSLRRLQGTLPPAYYRDRIDLGPLEVDANICVRRFDARNRPHGWSGSKYQGPGTIVELSAGLGLKSEKATPSGHQTDLFGVPAGDKAGFVSLPTGVPYTKVMAELKLGQPVWAKVLPPRRLGGTRLARWVDPALPQPHFLPSAGNIYQPFADAHAKAPTRYTLSISTPTFFRVGSAEARGSWKTNPTPSLPKALVDDGFIGFAVHNRNGLDASLPIPGWLGTILRDGQLGKGVIMPKGGPWVRSQRLTMTLRIAINVACRSRDA